MVHRSGLRPADDESEPNYWLGYSSRPRTDQHVSVCLCVCVSMCVNEIPTLIFYVRKEFHSTCVRYLTYLH
jgi:hypothetical protein